MNAVITQGFQIGNVNRFLRSLEAVDEVEFKDYGQYNDLIMDIMEAIESAGLEFLIEFKKNKKDFPVYTIKEVYES
jgi:myosin-crossreactive antigen